ncbi:putative neutral sphingomyelinase [Trichinella pseudospiralis]|uniref:sphingomyelin phosphodiesterase n=1 Tax=Trichinella pseudospiralis TaxID=6337 RepID=A0A0V1KF69_TRIPS|nr:putative neutral sphingomyelinase [Trichinella pseudospiralis]
MTDFLQLRVLTLNCWGIPLPFPFGSTDRKVRIKEIAKELATGKYDIVSLQEIWSENDFNIIRNAVRLVMPYSFYFHNGYAGSGVCVFSKGIILETLMHRYSLNGYVHHIHRGDWFGGKMVGLCRIQFSGININVYATHIHAEYNHDEDVYLAHRVVQAFELGQFMRNTMQNCEMSILMGDLNLRPTDLGYDLIRHSASLKDAWLERSDDYSPDGSCKQGLTCELKDNCYTKASSSSSSGKRIDYIFYWYEKRTLKVAIDKCFPTLCRIPNKPNLCYSDHSAVYASLNIARNGERIEESNSREVYEHLINFANQLRYILPVVESGLQKVTLLACIVHMDSGRGIALAKHHFTDNYISIFINFIDWILFLVWTGLSKFRRESVENDHIKHAYSIGTIFLL